MTAVTPLEVRNANFDHVDVTFSRDIDPGSFTASDVTLGGIGGAVAVSRVAMTGGASARIDFIPITVRGGYTLTIGPDVRDTLGNQMDQNGNNTAGEATDRSVTSLVYVSANVIFATNTTIGETNLTYDGQDLLIDGGTVAVDGPHSFNSVHIINGGVLTHTANTTTTTHKLDLTVAEQVIVYATSRIDVTGKGYVAGRTTGNTAAGGAVNAGGSHGGLGAVTPGPTNAAYGDYADPADWGAGGANFCGGGVVRITAGTLQLDGVLAAGGSGGSYGAGAGGSVYVSADTLAGAGAIGAWGGGGLYGFTNGGGGGGRVAVCYRALAGFDPARVTAGGFSAGTVYLRDADEATGTLVIDNDAAGISGTGVTPLGLPGQATAAFGDAVVIRGGRTKAQPDHTGMTLEFRNALTVTGATLQGVNLLQVTLTGSLLVSGGGTLQVAGSLVSQTAVTIDGGTLATESVSAPSLSVLNASVLTSLSSTAAQMHKLEVNVAGTIAVDSSSRIDVTGKGYVAGRTTGNTTAEAATGGSGGSHGGKGALAGTGVVTNAVYGDYADPADWGAGGVNSPGGGLVRITAGTLQLDGVLAAGGSGGSYGAGAGGSVYVSADTLAGAGAIGAWGGGGGNGNYINGGGGGGRVAVYYRALAGFDPARVTAGGFSAGTVYLRDADEATGTLVIDNDAAGISGTGVTPLGLPGQATAAFGDAVVIRGGRTKAQPDHTGMTLEFRNALTVTGGRLEGVEQLAVAPAGSLLVTGGGFLEVSGALTAQAAVTVSGATVAAGQVSAPALSVVNAGLLTSLSSTAAQMHKLEVNVAGTIAVDSSSRIDVTGKGYVAGRTTGNTAAGGAVNAGGSHGGLGAVTPGPTNAAYGDYADPADWGAGGANFSGGGVVRITAGTLQLDGVLAAGGSGGSYGAGAGGSVYVSADTLAGAGAIGAWGGGGLYGFTNGGGGGGRVAVYYRALAGFDPARVTAGGFSAGTVYLVNGFPRTHVRTHSPAGNEVGFVGKGDGYVPEVTYLMLTTNKPLDLSTFPPSAFEITGQMGRITPTSITLVGDRTYRIDLPFPLTENGTYHFRLVSTVKDVEGFRLDQDADGIPGETLQDDYVFDLTVDSTPPRIVAHTPAGDVAGTVSSVDVLFSEAMNKTSLTTGDVVVTRPDGQTVSATAITEIGLNRFRVSFPAQTLVGSYQVKVGPDVRDRAGNRLDQDRDGNFGEPVEDVYVAAFNIVQVDLGLTNVVVGSAALVAGEPVTVSWSGVNRTGAPLVGNWIDGVYLSKDGVWDINDTVLATVPHTGGLAAGATYTGAATVNVPGKLPGNYRIVVRSDVANQERETNEADNQIASVVLSLGVRPLATTGAPVTGTLSPADRLDFYAITLGKRESLTLKLDSAAGTRVELAVSYAAIPTRVAFDARSASPGPHQEVTLTGIAGGGTYYVMVYGDQVGGGAAYTLKAEKAEFFVTGVTPTRHGTAADAVMVVTGVGFDESTRVSLLDPAGPVVPYPTQFVSPTTLLVTLDLTHFRPERYGVRVLKADEAITLPNAFEVVAGGTATLETNLVVPGNVSPGFPAKQTVWVEYRNSGTVAMPAPLLSVSVGGDGFLTTSESVANQIMETRTRPVGLGGTVQVLGIGSTATPGTLQPGESARIPVYFVGFPKDPGGNNVSFTLGSLTALDTTEKVAYLLNPDELIVYERPGTGARNINVNLPSNPPLVDKLGNGTLLGVLSPSNYVSPRAGGAANTREEYLAIDWPAVEAQRPASVPADAWQAVLVNLRANYGDLWADYVNEMAQNANYLASVGQTTSDVGALWAFEVAQASAALSPIRYLAGAVDASVPAPGLPLTFSRVYGQDIPSRFTLGVMGRGWTHSWDVSARVDELTGDVTLHGPGGVARFFTKRNNGTYTASPGDYGTLTLTGGVFNLVETDKTLWQFNTDRRLEFVQDTNGNRISLAYADGLLSSVTHSNGRQLVLAYSGAVGQRKLLASVTDTAGAGASDDRVTTYEYDANREQLVRVTAPGNRVTSYDYAPLDLVTWKPTGPRGDTNPPRLFSGPKSYALQAVTYADGTHDYFNYDAAGRLVDTSKDGGTEAVTFGHDAVDFGTNPGRVRVTDASGRVTTLNFGLGGQLVQVRDGDGRVVSFGYDTKAQFSDLTGPGGERYRYAHDAAGNLTGVRDALNLETTFTYEAAHQNLASFTDARGNGLGYEYDTKGNLKAIVYEDGSRETFTYDAVGNVLTATNRRAQVTTYTYNAAGQVLTKDYSTTPGPVKDFVYTYDSRDNLRTATDAGGTTTLTYDPVTDRLTRIDYPGGHWFAFTYDAAGRRATRTDETGRVLRYGYDALGRLDTLSADGEGVLADYDYDAAGRLATKTLGNGVYTTYAYDAAGNVEHLVNYLPGGAVLSRFDYGYDASGRRTSMTTLAGTFTYGYDALGQLVRVEHPDGRVVVYDYDAAGNRRRVTDDGVETDYTANDLNQYTQVGGVTYTFDADGNLKSKTENGVTTTYAFDAENRLTGVTGPDGAWTYRYDALGNRVGATANGVATTYVIDPTGLGNVAAEYGAGGALVARYDHGYGLVSRADGAGAAFYTFEAIGHTSELTGAGGQVLNSYRYDPFGVSLGKSEAVANPFEYVGEYGVMNEGNGLEFMRARHYHPTDGQFIQYDPLGIAGGLNGYSYTDNGPVSRLDPVGLSWVDDAASVVGGAIGVGYAAYASFISAGVATPFVAAGGIASAYQLGTGLGNLGSRLLWGLDPVFSGGVWQDFADAVSDDPAVIEAGHIADYWFNGPDIANIYPAAVDIYRNRTALRDLLGRLSQLPVLVLPLDWPVFLAQLFSSALARSRDPNDKLAPAGFGGAAFVLPDSSLAYTVRFENQADATAPAHDVLVTDILDPTLDLDTFELTEVAFAGVRLAVPAGRDHYAAALPFVANGVTLRVEVAVDLDRATRTLTLSLRATDLATGWTPENPLLGLLYPEDGTGRGQGSFSYRIRPLAGLPTGTVIENRARITFDQNDPIDTPAVRNTLDAAGPTSRVTTPTATITGDTLTLTWAGEDDPGGSGVAGYDVFASVDGGAWFRVVFGATATSTTFSVVPGHAYGFYSVARDLVGHTEAAPATADAVVTVVNTPPVLAPIGNRTVNEGNTFTFTATATDPDAGQTLRFTLDAGAPAGAGIDPTTGVFTWATTEADGPGVYAVTVRVTDDANPAATAFETITVTVGEVNLAPVLAAVGDRTVNEGELVTIPATAADPDLPANALTFTLTGAPAGASIDPTTGVFTWTPTEAQGPATFTFTVRVTDNGTPALFDEEAITVTVGEVNTPPVLDPIPDQTVDEGNSLTFTVTAHDGDLPANTLTLSATGLPAGATFVPATGVFTWTPTELQDDAFAFDVHVSDGTATVTRTVRVTVREVNAAPVLTSPGDQTVDELTPLNFTLGASDVDRVAGSPNTFTYAVLSGAQPGMTLDPVTGAFSWTPTEAQDGTYAVTFRVADNGSPSLADTKTVTITAREANQAPVLAPVGDRSIDEGSLLTVTALAADADLPGNTLTFSLAGGPAGAAIDPVTGVFTWAPTDGPGSTTIAVRVTDDGSPALSATRTFTVTVGNVAPTAAVTGPATATLGQPVTFTLTAADPSPADQAAGFTFEIDWDGDGLVDQTVTGPSGTLVAHTFAGAGPQQVTVTATDKDGGASEEAVAVLSVGGTPGGSGTAVMSGTTLVVTGSDGDDVITVRRWHGSAATLVVRINGVTVGTFTSVTDILARGMTGNDRIVVGHHVTQNARLEGGDGDDYLQGGAGDDTLLGQGGDDEVRATRGDDALDGGAGDDRLVAGSGRDLLVGGAGSDTLRAGSGGDVLYGGPGGDVLSGGSGSDTLDGEDGNDTVSAGGGADTVRGGAGDDYLDGEGGADSIAGGAGNDTLVGGAGEDVLDAGDGDDVFLGWGGVFVGDTLRGGAGTDRIVNPGEDGGLALTAFGAAESVEEVVGAACGSNQHVAGTSGADVLNFAATRLTNLLYVDGRGGADAITASALTTGMRYVGGSGGDTFAVAAAAAGTEHVLGDFRTGTDRLDLRALGVQFSDLMFVAAGADRLVRIRLASGAVITLRLKNVSTNPPASDFLFA
ncbi:putative Ig domain-containing protein [Urbifossiella limnaea]|uniref:putative Ig domain-containing protein n=1 Tax=Urbifossiella limnaea TaxID=2528023 RepID=UPI0011A12296|nr:putative Ig domain-containing protein [Urbifossiella limnaea]